MANNLDNDNINKEVLATADSNINYFALTNYRTSSENSHPSSTTAAGMFILSVKPAWGKPLY